MSSNPELGGAGIGTLDLDGAFEALARQLEPELELRPAPAEEQIPFGPFTAGEDVVTAGGLHRAALATATGHTGNNSEESC